MKRILEDSRMTVEYCRDLNKQELVVRAIMQDHALKSHIVYLWRQEVIPGMDRAMLMNDTILSFIRICLKQNFEINTSVTAYLKKIATNVWLMGLRKKKISYAQDIDPDRFISEDLTEINRLRELKKITSDLLGQISADCKDILQLWALNFKMREIAQKLSYRSEKYVKKKKSVCLKKLIAYLDNRPDLKIELRDYV